MSINENQVMHGTKVHSFAARTGHKALLHLKTKMFSKIIPLISPKIRHGVVCNLM